MAARESFEVRAEIVGIARRLFIENGVHATTMNAVAAAQGVSKPTIYEHFESKTDLIQAVVESAMGDVDVSLIASVAKGEISFEEYLNRLSQECFDVMVGEAGSALLLLFVKEGLGQSEMATALRSMRAADPFPQFESMIAAVMRRGECRTMSPRIALRMFEAPLHLLMLQLAEEGIGAQDREAIRSYSDHYFLMLKNYMLIRPVELQGAA
jgi:AcrR family transcriptional regulator